MIEGKSTIYGLQKTLKLHCPCIIFPIYKVVTCTLPQFTSRRPNFKDGRMSLILFFGLKVLPKDSFLISNGRAELLT